MSAQRQAGFTLIELMIVVTVVGMLAASAIPQYQDYLIRSQVSEGLSLAAGVETAMADYYNINNTWPSGLTGGGGALSYSGAVTGRTVSAITTTSGGITITYGLRAHASLQGKTVGINAATTAAGNLLWLCGNATAPTGATAVGSAVTNVASRYLPKNCQ